LEKVNVEGKEKKEKKKKEKIDGNPVDKNP